MKQNYDLVMEKQIAERGDRNKLLLHACCAPCTSGCIDRLTPHFDLTVYFYNPNISTKEEYDKRAAELGRFLSLYAPQTKLFVAPYIPEEFLQEARGLEDAPERGARCEKCYRMRLAAAEKKATEEGCDFFATTLTLSPLKNAELLNTIGLSLQREGGPEYLCSDFKKRGGNVRSGELCREFDLYRQNFCGCGFSKKTV